MSLARNNQQMFQNNRSRLSISCLIVAICCTLSGSSVVNAQVAPQLRSPAINNVQYDLPNPNRRQVLIQQVQGAVPSNKSLPASIASMPTIQEEMDVIHRRSQLVVTHDNVVRMAIADPSIIDVVQYSPNEISIIGLSRGSTTLTIWFENNAEPLIYLVKVIRDPSLEDQRRLDYGKLEKKLVVLFPDSKVYLIPLSGKIIVKGQAKDAEEAARILQIIRGEVINQYGSLSGPQPDQAGNVGNTNNGLDQISSFIVNMLDVPGEFQVMLHVRIAELNRSHLRQLGVDLNLLIDGGRHVLTSTLGGAGGVFSGIFNNGEISVLVNWLASNGTAKILTEPTLTVLSGHSASFLSGGEFAVPTIVGVGGAQGTTTTFRGFGTSLIVTPTIINRDLIRMRIVPEFSSINGNNAVNGIPGVDSRRVQTTVQLREGQTIVLAGLLSNQTSTEVTRIPFLGELPLIGGPLFNTKRASQDQTELLIMVTPEIVRPMEADEVPPVPGHEVTVPNDIELYKYAMTEGAPDQRVYQLPPYGNGSGYGHEVGYRNFNPAPASPQYAPVPTNPYSGGFPPNGYPQQAPFRPNPATPRQNPNYQQQSPGYPNRGQLAPVPDPRVSPMSAPRPGPSAYRSQRNTIVPAGGGPRMGWSPGYNPNGNGVTPAGYQPPNSAVQRGRWKLKFPTFRKRRGQQFR